MENERLFENEQEEMIRDGSGGYISQKAYDEKMQQTKLPTSFSSVRAMDADHAEVLAWGLEKILIETTILFWT